MAMAQSIDCGQTRSAGVGQDKSSP